MQEAWAEFRASCNVTLIANHEARGLQRIDMLGVPLDIGEQGDIVAGIDAGEMGL